MCNSLSSSNRVGIVNKKRLKELIIAFGILAGITTLMLIINWFA